MINSPEVRFGQDQYSTWMGLVYVFNLIVGTGALTLPAAFAHAGWLMGSVLIIALAFISYMTVTFIIESISCANAIIYWKKMRDMRRDRVLINNPNAFDSHSSGFDSSLSEDDSEDDPLFRDESRYFDLDKKLELGEMATLFFNKPGRVLFFLCFVVYLYGDLSIYSAAVSKTLTDLTCTYRPTNYSDNSTLPGTLLCLSSGQWNRDQAYKLYLIAFALTLGPFVFFNVQKTKYLQLFTSLMRWLAFCVMIGLATNRIITHGPIPNTKMISLEGVPALFGACVYSFMCHHSIPSLVAPVRSKTTLKTFIFFDYVLICLFYLLLALTGIFAFEHLEDLYTLNFTPSETDGAGRGLKVVEYVLTLFPVFTLSTSFPIMAITLKNNLHSIFFNNTRLHRSSLHVFAADSLFPLLAVAPPILIASFTENLTLLVGFTGSYGGNGVQYLIPAFLVYYARKTCSQILGDGIKNQFESPFRHSIWIILVVLWSIACISIVTFNFFGNAWL